MNPPDWPIPDDDILLALEAAYRDGSWGKYRGPHVERLEARLAAYHEVDFALTCASGTFAVELALRALKVEPDDEVLLAAYDYGGNFLAIHAVGARPVLVDVDPANWNLDVNALAAAVGPATRALIVSHLHGGLVPMRAVMAFAEKTWPGRGRGCRPGSGGADRWPAGRQLGRCRRAELRRLQAAYRRPGRGDPDAPCRHSSARPDLAISRQHRQPPLGIAGRRLASPARQARCPKSPPGGQRPRPGRTPGRRSRHPPVCQCRMRGTNRPITSSVFNTMPPRSACPATDSSRRCEAEGVALDEGFSALHIGRSPRRFRAVGDLAEAERAHRGAWCCTIPSFSATERTWRRLPLRFGKFRRLPGKPGRVRQAQLRPSIPCKRTRLLPGAGAPLAP